MWDLLGHWTLIEADMHQWFGADLSDPAIRRGRTMRWLRARIAVLACSTPGSRLQQAFFPDVTPRYLYPLPKDQRAQH